MDRLPTQRIEVPAANPADAAVDIVVGAMREAGLDPEKCIHSPMVRLLVVAWRDGELDRPAFIRACKNLGILNPTLLEATK